jgi:hypothetical protein
LLGAVELEDIALTKGAGLNGDIDIITVSVGVFSRLAPVSLILFRAVVGHKT